MGHAWGETLLTPAQKTALREIETRLASGELRVPICLIGDFRVGKTTLAKYWLASHFDAPEGNYLAANRPLLEALKREADLDTLASLPAKTRLLLQLAMEDLLQSAFQTRDALVLDHLELMQPYHAPLIPLVSAHTRQGKVAILCLPDSPKTGMQFDLRPFECHLVKLDAEA